MRIAFCVCAALGCCWPLASNADVAFPYTAFIDSSGTSLLSGPGEHFYAADRLEWGTKVEVYRHDDNKWAAIRPTAGSFSWIPVAAVEPTDQPDLVRVKVRGIRTRIGSEFSDKHSSEYIKLQKGELLEVLGRQRLAEPPGQEQQDWYKIAPPAGEFRWVRLSALSKTPPTKQAKVLPKSEPKLLMAPDELPTPSDLSLIDAREQRETPSRVAALESGPDPRSELSPLSATASKVSPPLSAEVVTSADEGQITTLSRIGERAQMGVRVAVMASDGESGVVPAQWSSYESSPGSRRSSPRRQRSPWREVNRFSNASPRIASLPPSPNPLFAENSEVPPSAAPPLSSINPSTPIFNGTNDGEFLQRELAEIELELANVASGPPESWTLTSLRSRAQAVVDASQVAKYRDQAQRLIAKIAQFEDVQRRRRQMSSGVAQVDSKTLLAAVSQHPTQLGGLANYSPKPSSTTAMASTQYDGSGWLMPVVTRQRGLPRYVLADENGGVIQFVTPQPGLNLNSYIRQRVGVFGQKSFLPAFQRPHLMAQRVVSLDSVR